MVHLLTFTTLFPNAVMPSHGVFVEQRLKHLLRDGETRSKVVAPIPWFPLRHNRFGRYARFASVPKSEERDGLEVFHPRYAVIPKFGMSITPVTLAAGSLSTVKKIAASGYEFDVIDAHYFYPDGVAAILLGAWLNKPVVITARGTDINLIPEFTIPRKLIQWAASRAVEVVTVCQALKDSIEELGVPTDKITVLRNGVDLARFKPMDKSHCREKLNLRGTTLLSVGLLNERKGHHIIIEALKQLPKIELMIAGEGEEEAALKNLARQCGVSDRVRFLGLVNQEKLPEYYCAADALVLASSREGWANVLLEAMACGTPVVATNVWGTPEVVRSPQAGVLMEERTPQALASAVNVLLENYPDTMSTRHYAEGFSWDDTTLGQKRVFDEVVRGTSGMQ